METTTEHGATERLPVEELVALDANGRYPREVEKYLTAAGVEQLRQRTGGPARRPRVRMLVDGVEEPPAKWMRIPSVGEEVRSMLVGHGGVVVAIDEEDGDTIIRVSSNAPETIGGAS
jgi:hypothetical protein